MSVNEKDTTTDTSLMASAGGDVAIAAPAVSASVDNVDNDPTIPTITSTTAATMSASDPAPAEETKSTSKTNGTSHAAATTTKTIAMNGNGVTSMKMEANLPSVTETTIVVNGASNAAGPAKTDDPIVDEEEDSTSLKSEGAEEEDALFTNLEQEVEQEEASHAHRQPDDATAAPKLLQSAIKKGEVMEDSDSDEKTASKAKTDVELGEEKKAEAEGEHVHQRVGTRVRDERPIVLSCLLAEDQPSFSPNLFITLLYAFLPLSAKPTGLFAFQGIGVLGFH